MGSGIGECSSDEEKYKWRKALNEEWDETPENRRRLKYGKGNQPGIITKTKQVRTEPADVANTVLKMSKKRALVDACLTTLGASDIFAQDLEDLSEDLKHEVKTPVVQAPKPQPVQDAKPQPFPEPPLFDPSELDRLDQTEAKAEPHCGICGNPAKFVPAGTSKKTGKEYGAFFVCECVVPETGKKWSIRKSEWEKQ